jgi:hypothetical protein
MILGRIIFFILNAERLDRDPAAPGNAPLFLLAFHLLVTIPGSVATRVKIFLADPAS